MQKRVHILSAVNAKNVRRTAKGFVISNVCAAVDDIVMNGVLYPAAELAKAAATLKDKPAPLGHPKNEAGQYISANSGDALLNSYAGVICRNPRHEGGRTVVDFEANERQLGAHPDGAPVVNWCTGSVDGASPDPIHVSTGLLANMLDKTGTSGGKQYTRVATDIVYDHLAILTKERGAGTPEQGVGMFNDGSDTLQEVEVFTVNAEQVPEDKRSTGLLAMLNKLIFRRNAAASELSFDAIREGLWRALQAAAGDGAWLQEVYDRYAIWSDGQGKTWQQDYSVSKDGSVAFFGTAEEVRREVTYQKVTTNQKEDHVKENIVAALNAAGISGVAAMTDAQLLEAYNAVQSKPHLTALNAANSKVAGYEQAANAAADAELNTVATELATNSKQLTLADFKAMGLVRCKELKATAKAAPVVVGNAGSANNDADEFAGYDINKLEA